MHIKVVTIVALVGLLAGFTGCATSNQLPVVPESEYVWTLPAGSVVQLPAEQHQRMVIYDSYVVERSMFRQMAEVDIGEPIPEPGEGGTD